MWEELHTWCWFSATWRKRTMDRWWNESVRHGLVHGVRDAGCPSVRLVTGEYADAFLARYPEFKEQNRHERSRKRFADCSRLHSMNDNVFHWFSLYVSFIHECIAKGRQVRLLQSAPYTLDSRLYTQHYIWNSTVGNGRITGERYTSSLY